MPNKSNSGRSSKPTTLGSLGDNTNLKVPALRIGSAPLNSPSNAVNLCPSDPMDMRDGRGSQTE